MNKRGLFGINILLIVVFFVLGIVVGGYVVLKTQGILKDVTSFVIDESDNTDNANLDDSTDSDDEIVLEDFNDSDDLGNFSFDELNGSNNLTFNSS